MGSHSVIFTLFFVDFFFWQWLRLYSKFIPNVWAKNLNILFGGENGTFLLAA